MATWTDIDDARLEPGKPIRSVDGLALRDNPIAMAQGAEGAPRIEVGAFPRPEVGEVVIATLAVTAPFDGPAPAYSKEYIVFVGGALRIRAYGATSIQKNGSNIAGAVSYVDVAVSAGDRIRISLSTTGGGSARWAQAHICAHEFIFCGA